MVPRQFSLDPCRRAALGRRGAFGALVAAVVVCALSATAGAAATERLEILLDPTALPETDRARFADRQQSIGDAIQSGLPLWRSFEAREVLGETLAALARHGVDLGDMAVVNFDSIEAEVPAAARQKIQSLPFVSAVRDPLAATPSGSFDSEGLEAIGSDIANAAGLTGAGVTVAIIDPDWKSLSSTVAAGDLPAIPLASQFKINRLATLVTSGQTHNNQGDREHGTAAAEVVHEVAPGATLLLYRPEYLAAGNITAAQVKLAIRRAAEQGAKVILVPLHFLSTMSDPKGIAAGGTNPFADDITYATSLGATVVVAAGNEALRHHQAKFTPCTDCNPQNLCNTATNDSAYHIFDDDLPLNDVAFDPDYEDAALADFSQVKITCYSATDAAVPANFKYQLLRFRDNFNAPDPPDYPLCPNDAGVAGVDGTDKVLGESFTKVIPLFNETFDDYYFIAVRRLSGTARPNFRINCTVSAGELTYFTETGSLSDLAVADDSLAVGATLWPSYEVIADNSSWGPTGNPTGPVKPDLVAPGEVTNFAVQDFAFAFSETFNGTSAASAHVAGVVALLQQYRMQLGLAPFTPAEVKQVLFASALEIDDGDPDLIGPDPIYGHGLVQLPAAVLPGVPEASTRDDWDGDGKADPAYYEPSTSTWAWRGSTSGPQTLTLGGPGLRAAPGDYDGDGRTDAAIYAAATGSFTIQGSTTPVPSVTGLGGPGFLPVPGDYDGDGKTDPAVYDPATGTWRYKGSTSGSVVEVLGFGGSGRLAVPADYDGDGKTDIATYKRSNSTWSYIGSTEGEKTVVFGGGARFLPAPADYDGDGIVDLAVYQKKKGRWRFRLSSLGNVPYSITGLGGTGWLPVPADFDGDGKADPAAYRTATGLWRWQRSATGETVNSPNFGGPGRVPVVAFRAS